MNFLQRISKKILGITEGAWSTIVSATSRATTVRHSLTDTERKAMYRGWAFIAIKARARDMATIQFKLHKLDSNGDTVEMVNDHPILDALYGFNESTTKQFAMNITSQHLDIFGEAYWKIIKNGDAYTFRIIIPSEMEVICDSDGALIGWKRTWWVKGKKHMEALDLTEVIHFKDPNPFNLSRGASNLEGGYEWIESEINATEWNRNFFKRGGVPDYVFETETTMDSKAFKRLQSSFEDEFMGRSNSGRIGRLPKGVKLTRLGDSTKDMDFTELDQRSQNKILALFGVPRTILGITEDVNRANAEATQYVYAFYVVRPRMEQIVETLNEFFVPQFKNGLYLLDFESPVPDDVTAKYERLQKGTGSRQFVTANEARAEIGLPPAEGGDVLRGSVTDVEVGTVEGVKIGPKEIRSMTEKAMRFKSGFRNREKIFDKLGGKIFEAVKSVLENDDMDEIAHKSFVSRVLPLMKQLREKMIKLGNDLAKDVDENIESWIEIAKDDKAAAFKLYEQPSELVGAVVDLAKPILYEAFQKEGEATNEQIGVSAPFEITEAFAKTIDERLNKLGRSYNDTTVELIKISIQEGLTEGLNVKEIAKKVQNEVFEGKNEVRADLIANTETFRVANLGARASMSESGVVETVRWYTAEDERVCPYCAPLNGTTVGVDETFFNEGDVVEGEDGSEMKLDYDDVHGGPLHPKCRCYVRPEVINT